MGEHQWLRPVDGVVTVDTDPVVICGLWEALCQCVLLQGHDGPHRCGPGCDGSWTFNEAGEFVTVRMPRATGEGAPR